MGTSQLNKKTTTNNKKCRKYQVSQCQLGSTFIKNSFKPIISHFLGNLQLSTPTNSNEDYGGHHKTLNFPKHTISRYIDHQQDSSIRISAFEDLSWPILPTLEVYIRFISSKFAYILYSWTILSLSGNIPLHSFFLTDFSVCLFCIALDYEIVPCFRIRNALIPSPFPVAFSFLASLCWRVSQCDFHLVRSNARPALVWNFLNIHLTVTNGADEI